MSFDSDIALIGTGVAPLVAAAHLLSEGKSVLLLNPDRDFFLEDSELPFDPMIVDSLVGGGQLADARLLRSIPESALEALRPGFPGAVEYWAGPDALAKGGFRDPSAPCLRSRARMWVRAQELGELEDLFVIASDMGLNPRVLQGLQVSKRFPGATTGSTDLVQGIGLPKLYDIDVNRYRNGLLEFVRDRSGPGRESQVICGAKQLELLPHGIKFHSGGRLHAARLKHGLRVFWTPRLTQWILSQANRIEVTPILPRGIRLWEQWSLLSRYVVEPQTIGVFDNLAVWAELEGYPDEKVPVNRLALLRGGPVMPPLVEMDAIFQNVFDSVSLNTLGAFFNDFLKWEHVTVRAMKARAIFEWESRTPWSLSKSDLSVLVVPGCDGPLADVVSTARDSCSEAGKA